MTGDHSDIITDLAQYFETIAGRGLEIANRNRPHLPDADDNPDRQRFYQAVTVFLDLVNEAYECQKRLARGDLSGEIQTRNSLTMPLQALHSSLRHLTWQASRVAGGDLGQEVHFLGEFAESFNKMIRSLREKAEMQNRLMLAQKMEAIGELATGLAHEINTPAQYMGANMSFLLESVRDIEETINRLLAETEESSPAVHARLVTLLTEKDWPYLSSEMPKAIQQTQNGVDKIKQIVHVVNEFARPKERRREPCDLNALLENAITLTSGDWRDIAEIELCLADNIPETPVIADAISQVFVNIIMNATQAIKEKKQQPNASPAKGRLTISSDATADCIEIRVADTGVGIAPELIPRIFDPFFTTREVGQGSGQGLAISYQIIVDQHQGRISFSSEPGKGTTCTLCLPLS